MCLAPELPFQLQCKWVVWMQFYCMQCITFLCLLHCYSAPSLFTFFCMQDWIFAIIASKICDLSQRSSLSILLLPATPSVISSFLILAYIFHHLYAIPKLMYLEGLKRPHGCFIDMSKFSHFWFLHSLSLGGGEYVFPARYVFYAIFNFSSCHIQ